MEFFKDKRAKKKLNKTFEHIEKNLNKVDSEVAVEFLDWLDRKTLFFRQSINRNGYGKQPDDLKRGDIVWVEFGINVGTELSDYATKGHYAVVWAVDLGNVIVLPLTSKYSPGSRLTYELGILPNLVEENEMSISYLKLDAIRSISKRRIGRMPGKDGGKVRLSEENIKYITSLLQKEFIDT